MEEGGREAYDGGGGNEPAKPLFCVYFVVVFLFGLGPRRSPRAYFASFLQFLFGIFSIVARDGSIVDCSSRVI